MGLTHPLSAAMTTRPLGSMLRRSEGRTARPRDASLWCQAATGTMLLGMPPPSRGEKITLPAGKATQCRGGYMVMQDIFPLFRGGTITLPQENTGVIFLPVSNIATPIHAVPQYELVIMVSSTTSSESEAS